MFTARPFEETLQFAKLIVWKDTQNRAAQPSAIDQRCVAEFIEQNDVIFGDQGRNRSKRRGISTAETKRGFGSFPLCQRAFQAQMWRLRSADQPRRPGADTKFVESRQSLLRVIVGSLARPR